MARASAGDTASCAATGVPEANCRAYSAQRRQRVGHFFLLMIFPFDAKLSLASHWPEFAGSDLGYKGSWYATSSGASIRTPLVLNRCTVCSKSAAEYVSTPLGGFRFWAGELMLRKASSTPEGANKMSSRSRGDRIMKACGLNRGRKIHSPVFPLKTSSPTYTSNSPSRT